MKKSILRASAALQAVALLGAGSAAFIAATPAAAQDYTSGVLSGTVSNDAGRPIAGAQVVAKSIQLGTTISATTGANGEFTFASLPTGDYDVTVTSSGSQSYTATAVQVISGRTSSLPVVLSTQQSIVVVGRRVQAFTGTTTGLNVDVQQLQATVPIGRNLTSVVLLAPTTSQGDSAFGNLASVGGGSVAENAYYINGLNITNFDNYVGSATVPFDFYKSVEVKEGGYPAEFGRATGGIINAVTKSGTNDWLGAVHVTWSPEFLRDNSHVIQTCNYTDDTNTTIECSDANAPKYEYDKRLETTLELGGPIFRDRLFVYGLLQLNDHRYRTTSLTSGTAYQYKNNDPFWGAKIDAIPIDGHHFELTMFDTRNTTYRTDLPFSIENGKGVFGIGTAENAFHGGGFNYVGKYTGRLTDFFTISGAYGRYRDRFDYNAVAGAAGLPLVQNLTGGDVTANGEVVPYLGYTTAQRIGSYQAPYKTERKFWRGDADLLVNFVGSHHFRAGIDHENDFLQEGTYRSGNDFLCNTINPNTGLPYITAEACTTNGQPAGLEYLLRAGGKVELNYYNTKGQFTQKNTAIYLEDEWKPTDRLTINAGIRRDNFEVTDAAGQPFATLKNNWSPRVGITYNLWADKSGTIKAFYGTYYLPFASNTAFRNVGGELYFHQRYFYNGFDANGIPIIDLTRPVTNRGDYQARCPFDLVPGAVDDFCSVTGDGKVPSSATVIDHNLKATKEAEWILGYEQRWHGWKFGITGTYRKLLIESEDSAIDAAALAYCEANGISDVVNPDTGYTCAEYYTGFAQYVINNPGNPITVNLRGVEGQPLVTLTPEQLGYPKAKRTYKALEFTFDRPYDGVWSLGGSYTLSYSKGNSEGFVQSDFGQDDSGITQDFDQPGFIPGAYGYLPNDRRHKLKIYGSYTLWDRLTLGANYILQSPRHLSCFGYNPTDNFANVYGAASHYCGGVLSPRGTAQKSAWLSQLDLKVAYKVPLNVLGSNLTLRADVFNVFNSRSVQKRNEIGDLDYTPGDDGLPIAYLASPNYGLGTNYQAPRQIRLGLDIAFGGAAPPPPPPVEVAPPPPPPPAPPATQTCSDGSVILATDACPVPPPPPPPPAPAPERGN